MQIAVGDTVRNDPKNKAFLSWEDVSCRIHQLLQQGEYAPKSVLDAARGNALHEHAEALSYMERDMAEGVAEMVFADTSIFSGGYPELTERLAKLIDQPEFLADLNERLLGLAEAYAEDKSVMRMPFYRPDKVSEQFQKFALPFQPYQAREGFQWNEQEVFITEDEINAFLAGGGPYSDGRLATYSFFLTHTEKAERAAFLKDRYGVGGSSHALSRADNSHASYDGRGLELARGIYGKPDALVKLNWNQAAERVAKLIDQSLYLKPADYSRMPSYEREQMANRVIGFYHRLPDEVERPFKRELLNEDARKKLPTMLADPEQAVELLEKMDAALLSVPLDSPEYAEKSKTLAELHQYVEGTYTIFPEKKKAVEISVSETGQISLFDIWAQEQESKEHSTTAVVEEPQKQATKYSRNVGDDGYTGTNFNRPAFQKMVVDLKQGDIKVIMVKDLSRLGRDYIGVGDYIEQIFPLMGVRFIAVNNSFDSMKLNNGTPGIEVAVSNLVNNMYSRDIAKKIRAALETNWKNGKATCTNVPFGYVWNKKGGQRWEIDPEAAPCVKKVFELALSGRNTTQIAYGMNELNLPTPGLYAKRKNLLMGSNPIIAPDSEMLWNAAIVWRILRRYEYTGALVMGRRKKIDVNTTSVRTLPEDKWIIAENAHAAIVTRDEYYQAQKAIRNVTPIQYKVGDDFALKGKICCGNCNRQLRHERQYGEMVFYCGYKRSAGKFSKCYGGYYREHSVNAKVARAIKTVFYALDVVNQGMQEKQSVTVRCMDIEDLEKQAEAIRVEQIKLYESYADGVLLRDAYIEKKKALSEKLAALQDSIRTEKEEQECADELDEEIRALTKQASEKTYIGGLTKECVDAFVSMVYLYDDQTMKIEFNCEDVIRKAMEKYGA